RPDSKTALIEVNLPEQAESVQHDFQLVSASRLTGIVLDPAGKPLTGFYYSGFNQTSRSTYWRMDSGNFTINSYQPDHPRTVLFIHLERKLAGSLILKGPQSSPLRVRLQPWGAITGRLVDSSGKPMDGVPIARHQLKIPSDPQEGLLPARLFQAASDGAYRLVNDGFLTDRDGRFHIEGLAPGIKYTPWVWDQKAAEPLGELISRVTVKSGETKDLGTLTLKPLKSLDGPKTNDQPGKTSTAKPAGEVSSVKNRSTSKDVAKTAWKSTPDRRLKAEPNTDQGRTIAEIEKLGGKLWAYEESPGKPVTSVDLESAKVTDAGLESLKSLPHVRSLNLWETKVTDAGLAHVPFVTGNGETQSGLLFMPGPR
ncbi:MAG: carboxypeptidase regulatory-like domain-containing protein, partial [Thermoguttaceae bacterium]